MKATLILAALALCLAAPVAGAQGQTLEGYPGAGRSPRTGAFQFKLGSYYPLMRNEAGLKVADPFQEFFDGRSLLLFELEGQRFLYQGYGSAGLSFSAGYGERYAEGFLADGVTRGGEKTGLQVWPLSLGAFYKLDYPAERWGIPLVPYAEASLRFIPYRLAGTPLNQKGGKRGYGLTAGLQLMLDFLEPGLARNLDSDTGVNHSYLFAEYTHAEVNNFGKGGLDLSSQGWMFGLALDY